MSTLQAFRTDFEKWWDNAEDVTPLDVYFWIEDWFTKHQPTQLCHCGFVLGHPGSHQGVF